MCLFSNSPQVEFCKENGIAVTAYSPLGSRGAVELIGKSEILPNQLENPIIKEIAEKHNKTCAQIAIRHILEKGVATIPKSQNPERIYENIDVFNWELDEEDTKKLNSLDKGPESRICDFVSFFKGIDKHPEYPF